MELSPASAASEAFRAAEVIRIAAQKPKKEDYSDYKVFRREYKSWHGSWTRCHQEVHDPAKRRGRACGQLCGQLCGRMYGQDEGVGAAQCRYGI